MNVPFTVVINTHFTLNLVLLGLASKMLHGNKLFFERVLLLQTTNFYSGIGNTRTQRSLRCTYLTASLTSPPRSPARVCAVATGATACHISPALLLLLLRHRQLCVTQRDSASSQGPIHDTMRTGPRQLSVRDLTHSLHAGRNHAHPHHHLLLLTCLTRLWALH